jgi:predicted branched-subunit amino acid permease
MKIHKVLKWITGALEAVLGIPFIGGAIVFGFGWQPLVFMLIFHIVTLVITFLERSNQRAGSILGIVTSMIAYIPFVGMVMHIITAIVLLIQAAVKEDRDKAS